MKLNPLLVIAGLLLLTMVAQPQSVINAPGGCQFAGLQFYGSYWCHAKDRVQYEQATSPAITCSNDGKFFGQTVTCEGDISCPRNTPSCSVRVFPTTTEMFQGTDSGTGELIYYYPSGSEKSRSSFTIDFATGQHYQVPADSLKENERLHVKISRNFGTTLLNSPKVSMSLAKSYVPYELIISARGMNDIVGNTEGCSIAGTSYEKDVCASGCPNNLINQKIVPYGQFANFADVIVITDASTLPVHPVYGRGACNPVSKTFIPYDHEIRLASGACYVVPSGVGVAGQPETAFRVDVPCCPGQKIGSMICNNDFVLKPESEVPTTCSQLTGIAQCLGGGGAFPDTDPSYLKQATGCDSSGKCIYKRWKVECTYDAQCGSPPKFCDVATHTCKDPTPKPWDCRTQGCGAGYICNQITGECVKPSEGGIDWLLIAIVGGALILGYGVLGDKTMKKGRK